MKIQIMLAMNMMIILMKLHHHRSQTLGGFKKCFEDQDQIHEIAATGTMKMSANSPVRHFTFILVRFPLSCHNAKYRRKRKHKLGDRLGDKRRDHRPREGGAPSAKGNKREDKLGNKLGDKLREKVDKPSGWLAHDPTEGNKKENKLRDKLGNKLGDNWETSATRWKTR